MNAESGINPKLPTWDGNWRTFSDYKLACQLELDGLQETDQPTLAPRLARNLTGKAWETCIELDREKLRKKDGLDYLLTFLQSKRGKQQVDVLGEAFEKYFQSGEAIRHDKENLNDFEQRLAVYFRDISRALRELGNTADVPSEIYGWFLLNKHVRLDPSDLATLKSQAKSYKLEKVLEALRTMWGGESLAVKDLERKRMSKAYLVDQGDDEDGEAYDTSGVWWNEQDEEANEGADDEQAATEIWFEEALEALQESPTDEVILANFRERRWTRTESTAASIPTTAKGKARASERARPRTGRASSKESAFAAASSVTKPSIAPREAMPASLRARALAWVLCSPTGQK